MGGPAASSWDGNSLDVWAVGTNGNICHRACRNLDQSCTGNAAFGAWECGAGKPGVGIHATHNDIGAVSWGVNRVDLVVTGTDGQAYHQSYTTAGWGGWSALGGSFASGPSVTSWGVNRLDIYAKGSDSSVWHRAWQENQTWSAWESLNFAVNSPPFGLARGPRNMHITAIDSASNAWEDSCNGQSNCRAATPGTRHSPSVAFAPDLTARDEREVTSLVLPGTQTGCSGTTRVLYYGGNEPESTGIMRASESCLGSNGCAAAVNVNTNNLNITRVAGSWDNQLVRGPDGHALFIKQIFENSGGIEHVSEYVWKSTDCGANFTYIGKVDPTTNTCGAGKNYGMQQTYNGGLVAGGCDRHEVHTDPFGNGLYLTVSMTSDACGVGSFLYHSADGVTWVKRQKLPFVAGPAGTMTSTEAGNLYVLQLTNSGAEARVHQYSSQGQTFVRTITITNANAVWPSLPAMGANFRDVGGSYVSRVGRYFDPTTPGGFDVLRVLLPVTKSSAQGNYHAVDVYQVEVRATPTWSKVTTISPATGFSMRDITLIEPDRRGAPSGDPSNVALLTWRELNLASGASSEVLKYVAIRDVDSISTPAALSVSGANGTTFAWNWASDTGWLDYTKGSGFWTGSGWRFYGTWTQPVAGKMQVFTNWVDLAD